MPRLAARPRVARSLRAGGALVLALSLAACGSQLDPTTVVDGQRRHRRDHAQGGRGRARHRHRRATPRRAAPPAAPRPASRHDDRRRHDRPAATTSGQRRRQLGSGGDGGGDRGRRATTPPAAALAAPAATASRTARASPTPRSPSATPPTSPARCPGLFESSQDAVKAYVAYFNSTSDICGRKLKLVHLRQPHRRRRRPAGLRQGLRRGLRDGRLDVGLRLRWRRDRAVVRAARHPLGGRHQGPQRLHHLLPGRSRCNTGEWENAPGEFIKKNYPDAVAHAGLFYLNAGAAAENAPGRGQRDDQAGPALRRRAGHRRRGVQLRAVRPGAQGQGRQGRLLRRRLPAVRAAGPGDAADRLQARHLPA